MICMYVGDFCSVLVSGCVCCFPHLVFQNTNSILNSNWCPFPVLSLIKKMFFFFFGGCFFVFLLFLQFSGYIILKVFSVRDFLSFLYYSCSHMCISIYWGLDFSPLNGCELSSLETWTISFYCLLPYCIVEEYSDFHYFVRRQFSFTWGLESCVYAEAGDGVAPVFSLGRWHLTSHGPH